MYRNILLKQAMAGTTAFSIFFSSFMFTFPIQTEAAEQYPEARLQHSCFEKVWGPDEKELANDPRWRGVGEEIDNRIRYTSKLPDGKPSIISKAFEDVPAGLASLKLKIAEVDQRKAKVARLSTLVYIPEDNGFNKGNAKMQIGVWGMGDEIGCIANCPPPYNPELYPLGMDVDRVQKGFIARVSRQAIDESTSPVTHGPKIYSYHLNRSDAVVTDDVVYGESAYTNTPFPTGEWFKLIMDIRLDSWDSKENRSKKNGFVDLYMYDTQDNLLGEAHMENLIFRDDPSWHIMGPYLVDLWGGDYEHPDNIPTKTFNTYYRNHKMYIMKEGKYPGQCKN